MRVRPELVNKHRASQAAQKSGSEIVSGSFKEEVSKQQTVTEDRSSSGRKSLISKERDTRHANRPTENLQHHVSPRHHKNITTTQAQRLAKYSGFIKDSAKKHNVPVELVCAVILQESGGNPKAVSHAGARGLMQLMPGTAKRFGVTNSFDPQQNIEGGTKYLRFLLDRFKGDYKLAVAAYNAGEGNVEKYGNKIPPFAETRAYVPKVLAYADTIWSMLRQPQQVQATQSAPLPPHARRV